MGRLSSTTDAAIVMGRSAAVSSSSSGALGDEGDEVVEAIVTLCQDFIMIGIARRECSVSNTVRGDLRRLGPKLESRVNSLVKS